MGGTWVARGQWSGWAARGWSGPTVADEQAAGPVYRMEKQPGRKPPGSRHRETESAQTERVAGPDTESERVAGPEQSAGPDTESAGARHGEGARHRVPGAESGGRAPGPDAESKRAPGPVNTNEYLLSGN